MIETALVVLNYNGARTLAECLESARRLRPAVEVVVADNASTDGSRDLVRERFPEARWIDLGRNWGFAEGYNRALAQVDRPWLALLNNDAMLDPAWLERLLDAARREPSAAILGGKLLFHRPPGAPPLMQSAGARFTESGSAFELGWGQEDHGQFDQPGPVGSIPGAAMLIRRQVFADLGGFDGDYFSYLEDVDLCWRAWLAGHQVLYAPQALAYHHYGQTGGGRASTFRIRLMQRNRLATMFKNLEAASLPRGLAVSAAYDAYRTLDFGLRRHFAAVGALARGTAAFLRDLRPILARRAQVQRARRVSDHTLREMRLLVTAWEAFQEYRRLGRLAMSWE